MEVALDTNVLVRLFIDDDKEQHTASVALCENARIFISDTVLLETEWVLRGVYGISEAEINTVLTAFLKKPNVIVDDAVGLDKALILHAKGMDFADALHLTKAQPRIFYSFDEKLLRKAAVANLKVIKPATM